MALRSPALALAGPDIGHLDERASRAVLGTRAQRGTHAVNSCATGKVVAGGIEDAVLLQVPARVEAAPEKTQDSKSRLSGPGQTASIHRLFHVDRKCKLA